ncbi:MAG: hypothetical protein A3F53_00200 [Candidatus Zambryskibacteria bacterium RIFCSPHIGHO2_12_FULL_48_10]|uniref:Uncharacterized protein n=1 Tax=Candidatus Zambryskibacteria bacterium RIFCSPHIGHO2_01_FULL_46_25 TaxID=1802738 RepID=A0A1G2T2I7_9BACT|nr:MAG: hypothetical protein A2838_03470 [Candidatus Zambryskibacteria bacterium RIFCSPHIGHO2_01_FULL_46_25]OHB00767.1 MAG: hypothetical protein A3F53_00200 [Candidatus Zambryskibacteria bacterium RIFCSPHIGHO2_12_FULL_48_10]OHB07102.1 MAG: hypothetical protein A3A31_00020 [Candidatus Zambryskibacteria bacterium RIFCSPLOWO2_01_FULL_48_25]
MRKILRFFDRFEDKVRGALSHFPMFYAFLGGVAVVSFWRGVWETSDLLGITPQASLVFGTLIMMSVGILVTEFLGNRIIITGLRGDKKLEEKTLKEIEDEEMFLSNLKTKVDRIEKMLIELSKKKDI